MLPAMSATFLGGGLPIEGSALFDGFDANGAGSISRAGATPNDFGHCITQHRAGTIPWGLPSAFITHGLKSHRHSSSCEKGAKSKVQSYPLEVMSRNLARHIFENASP